MANVEFVMDDVVAEVEDGESLIQISRDNGSSIPFGCTNGVCGTCICKVVDGHNNLSEMGAREKNTLEMFGALDGDHRLACQCKVHGDVKLDNP